MLAMAIAASSSPLDISPSDTSLVGLDWLNFFLAGMQSGFGPFIAVLLAVEGWSQENIGFVLSAGGLAGLLSQLPGGELLDVTRSKRLLVALGASVVALSALVIAFWPKVPVVFTALILQALTGGFLGPAIAAISLGLVGHHALAERLGRNQRFASAGGVTATALMGAIGYFSSYQTIFLASAAFAIPLLFALGRIHPADVHHGRACGQPDHHESTPPPRAPRLSLWNNFGLLIFAICLFLFQFANASMLPLAGEALAYRSGTHASFVISAMIIVPQIVVVLAAPWVGREAQSWGRRPLLLIGFGALTVRALLFALTSNPFLLVPFQLLDGISGSVLGVLTALVIADLTKGTGRFNLAQGFVGTLSGIGAALSTTFFSLVVQYFSGAIGFISIAAFALTAVLIVWFRMPETRQLVLKQSEQLNTAAAPSS
jgi:MFS family permease